MLCERCGTETISYITSIFNIDKICFDCKTLERNHPLYEQARARELAEVQAGNYNYEGVGLPPELRP